MPSMARMDPESFQTRTASVFVSPHWSYCAPPATRLPTGAFATARQIPLFGAEATLARKNLTKIVARLVESPLAKRPRTPWDRPFRGLGSRRARAAYQQVPSCLLRLQTIRLTASTGTAAGPYRSMPYKNAGTASWPTRVHAGQRKGPCLKREHGPLPSTLSWRDSDRQSPLRRSTFFQCRLR